MAAVTAGTGVLAGVELREAGPETGAIGIDIAFICLLDECWMLESLSEDEWKVVEGSKG